MPIKCFKSRQLMSSDSCSSFIFWSDCFLLPALLTPVGVDWKPAEVQSFSDHVWCSPGRVTLKATPRNRALGITVLWGTLSSTLHCPLQRTLKQTFQWDIKGHQSLFPCQGELGKLQVHIRRFLTQGSLFPLCKVQWLEIKEKWKYLHGERN